MTNKEFYQETFSQVRFSGEIRWEEMEQKKGKKVFGQKLLVLAAVLSLLAVFSTAAVANDWFGLRNLELSEEMTVTQSDGTETVVTVPTGIINLQGFSNTPEKQAMEEWKTFLNGYDQDGAIISAIGNSPTGFEDEYGLYLVYTQEMADEFEEILTKYDLKQHTDMIDNLYTNEDLCAQVGGDFLGNHQAYSTYMYEDGTFKFDGEIDLENYGILDYQFMRCVRGSFTDVMLSIGDVRDYQEWVYSTDCGVPVTLALGPSKALVIVDLPDSFVTINVLAGTETPESDIFSNGPFMQEDLERFADSFDFSVLTPARPADPDLPRTSLEEVLETPSAEDFLLRSGVKETEAQAFYAGFFAAVEQGDRNSVAELLHYPGVVTTADGTFRVESAGEFLPYYDAIFTDGLWDSMSQNQYTMERADLFTNDGLIGAAGGAVWFGALEDGLLILTVQNGEGCSFRQDAPSGVGKG